MSISSPTFETSEKSNKALQSEKGSMQLNQLGNAFVKYLYTTENA